jgi:hypothetical protein
VSPATAQTTDAEGQASFTVTDTTAEPATLTATDVTDDNLLVGTVTVTFVPPSAPTVSPTLSTVSFSPATVTADGTTAFSVGVDLRNTSGQPVAGDQVVVTAAAVATPSVNDLNADVTPIELSGASSPGESWGSNGEASFQIKDTVAETIVLTATDTTASPPVALTSSPMLTFTPGTPDGVQSTVAATPTAVPADGTTHATVTVTLKDHFGNAIQGDSITLDQSGSSTISTNPSLTRPLTRPTSDLPSPRLQR